MIGELFNTEFFVRILASLICSAAFAVLFHAAPRHLPAAGLSGALAYLVYHVIVFFGGHVFAAAFFATAAGAVYAEIYARIFRTPVIVVLSAAIIPIVPGGDLYYTMQGALIGNAEAALTNFVKTMSIALGIAGGIVVVALAFRILSDVLAEHRKGGV